jgi:hypothetical protein
MIIHQNEYVVGYLRHSWFDGFTAYSNVCLPHFRHGKNRLSYRLVFLNEIPQLVHMILTLSLTGI